MGGEMLVPGGEQAKCADGTKLSKDQMKLHTISSVLMVLVYVYILSKYV